MAGGLLTDLYELNMAASYLRRQMTGRATFSLFTRHLPAHRGFLIAAGLEDCLAFLESFSFTSDDLAYLRRSQDYDEVTLQRFRELRFTGDVWAVPEGSAVFAAEPLLEVTAPIAEAQLAETVLLNRITFQTAIATKAARCFLAAGGAQLVDFSFRRTQGISAGLAVARASAIAGFTATSNVEAARRYCLTTAGTMAHSFIEAFGDDEAAFAAFAEDFPGKTTFLVDTYDTEQGIRAAIEWRASWACPEGSGSASTPVILMGWPVWPAACSTARACAGRGSSPAAAWTNMPSVTQPARQRGEPGPGPGRHAHRDRAGRRGGVPAPAGPARPQDHADPARTRWPAP